MNKERFNSQIISEIFWRTSRSGGKGGQHVNKTESRVELLFDWNNSRTFSSDEKNRMHLNLSPAHKAGIIRIVVQSSRSQHENKSIALDKLFEILVKSLRVQKKRKATRISRTVKQKRSESKKHRSQIKKQRSQKNWDND